MKEEKVLDGVSFAIGYTQGKQSASGGGSGGGGVELNIAYGDTPPEDTTKLWVKTGEPSGVMVSKNMETIEVGEPSLITGKTVPNTVHSHGGCGAVDGKIYILGGVNLVNNSNGSSSATKTITCYDPKTETFTTLATELPDGKADCASVVIGKKIYCIGGVRGGRQGTGYHTSNIYCFDGESKTVTTLPVGIGNAHSDAAACSLGTNILVFRGKGSTATADIYCIDTETNTRTTLPFKMPGTISAGYAISDGENAYYVGGNYNGTSTKSIVKIDVKNNRVIDLGIEVVGTIGYVRAMCGGRIYAFGYNSGKSSVTIIDPETGKMQTLSLSSLNANVTSAYMFNKSCICALDDTIYLFYGYSVSIPSTSSEVISKVYMFKGTSLQSVLENNKLHITPATNEGLNTVNIINTDSTKIKIGVFAVHKGNESNEAKRVDAALYTDGAWATI